MQLRIATWNINSVRLRREHLRRVVDYLSPDVLCLQETKVPDALFPLADCEALGYRHIAVRGEKGYNGVAILSRLPIDDVRMPSWCGREDCRHLIATIRGIEVHCLYVPAGGDVPDPDENPKFAHKLAFLDELTAWYRDTCPPDRKAVLLGDLNIAPLETDVWSHKQLLRVVSHTPVEVERLRRLADSVPFIDAVRHFIPPEQKLYTWWSYRAADWTVGDRGRRLDHIWATPALKDALTDAVVLREARNWDPPSDHVPVMVTLEV